MSSPSPCSSPSAPAPVAWEASMLDRFDTLLFDCDGVLWHEATAVPGAIAALARLHAAGKRLLFATNNSSRSRAVVAGKFATLGFTVPVEPDQVITSAQASAHHLANSPHFDKATQRALLVGESGLGEEMRAQGITVVETMHLLGTKHIPRAELAKLPLDPTIGAVVCGVDEQLTYTKVAYAVSHLHSLRDPAGSSTDPANRSCIFLSTNQDSSLPTSGHFLPGAGSCVAMTTCASSREPTNIGKPEVHMLNLAVALHSLDRSRVLMVGDRLDTDILFGENGGVATLLVTDTGVHTAEDIARLNIRPTFTAKDVTALLPETKL